LKERRKNKHEEQYLILKMKAGFLGKHVENAAKLISTGAIHKPFDARQKH
jgi:hypothetical protein